MQEDLAAFRSSQAVVARYVSQPGTEFRVMLRLARLHPWELGALLLTLLPTRELWLQLAEQLGPQGERFRSELDRQAAEDGKPLLAHKLGHGRPLGMGSVQFQIDGVSRLSNPADGELDAGLHPDDVGDTRSKAIAALASKLLDEDVNNSGFSLACWLEEIVPAWLAVHRYSGRKRYDYPRPAGGTDIFAWHSTLRKNHAANRKQTPGRSRTRHGLKDAQEI